MNTRLVEALKSHTRWLEDEFSGKRFVWADYEDIKVEDEFMGANLEKADFRNANLSEVNFSSARLIQANFSGANLRMANFIAANLSEAFLDDTNLSGAALTCANLHHARLDTANLVNASLQRANLVYANLRSANLAEAILNYADLTRVNCVNTNILNASLVHTNLTQANMNSANLSYANLSEANLENAVLVCANLSYSILFLTNFKSARLQGAIITGSSLYGVENLDTVSYDVYSAGLTLTCPEEGSYVGFKRVNDKIIKLEIPADALRSSSVTRKCRASKAKVLSITEFDGAPSNIDSIASEYDENFIYKVGETVEVKDFDTNRWHECSTGIHHFITRNEAVNYTI